MSLTDKEIEEGLAHLDHQFMTPQIWQEAAVKCFDKAECQDVVIPLDYFDNQTYSKAKRIGIRWWAMLSAPGYMDRTDPVAFDTEREAAEYLVEQYADDIDDCDDCRAEKASALD